MAAKLRTSLQLEEDTKRRLQAYTVLKRGDLRDQSLVIEEAINHYLDAQGFPRVEALP